MQITTDPRHLADLIYEQGTDWQPILSFLCKVARMQGVFINKEEVSDLIIERIG